MPSKLATPGDLEGLRESLRANHDPDRLCITVCGDTGCVVCGSLGLADLFRNLIEEKGLRDAVSLKVTGCLGFCEQGPVVLVQPHEIMYCKVRPDDVEEILVNAVDGGTVERLLYEDPASKERIPHARDIPFYKHQNRFLLEPNWYTDPLDINDYIMNGGYSAFAKALQVGPEEILAMVKESRLRGRGGAGFLTWVKWDVARSQESAEKYVICNADEGDPGAFMDRSLLEGNPHAVLEGMLIAGLAVGASHGIVYVRAEYPTAVKKVERAIEEMERLGLLGSGILGSDFDFEITVSKGAGAFVCGEETALILGALGRVGEPTQKPPYPAVRGYKGMPTVINNVETLANVPRIIGSGASGYLEMGTPDSGGTKIFCLVGKVTNTGLVEVSLGTTLRDIVFGVGGGIKNNKRFKALQTGGPSGGCLPEEMLDLPVDFEALGKAGSIMGSGGMIVMDEETCVVDLARYFLKFLQDESCGKCFSCREGIARMLEVIERISSGQGSASDLDLLEELALVVKDTSMCGLGQTSANPVLSTLRYFRSEYLAHVEEGRCPAAVCKALIRYSIDEASCTGCGVCRRECPEKAIEGEKGKVHVINQELCAKCGVCAEMCKFGAIAKA